MTRFLGGFAVTMGNPKMMLFYIALLPSVVPADRIDTGMAIALVITTLVVLSVVLGIYLFAAEAGRNAMASRRSVQRFNRATATVLGGAAVWIFSRQ